MLRARLLTSLVFNVVLAIWVYVDARARLARKPAFAAVLALVWGPLGLGFWQSDRPLGRGERRAGSAAANVAGGFLLGWIGLLPAIVALVMPVVEHRAAVPGSLGRQIGIASATSVAVAMCWGVPALLAWILGRTGRGGAAVEELGTAARASVPAWVAVCVAGAAALATALVTSPAR